MPASGFEHEVFVSYSTLDDYPTNHGWVSAFVNILRTSLTSEVGSRNPDRIWWDRSNIDEEDSLTDQIRTKVQKSACMVVILSQAYMKSRWCREEREAFLTAVAGQRDASRRLFLIDIGNLDLKDRPPEFLDKRGRCFYIQPQNTTQFADRKPLGFPLPDPTNKDHEVFFAQVLQLARDLRERVSKILVPIVDTVPHNQTPTGSKGTQTVAVPTPALPPKPHGDVTLFVAESADDVAEEREQVVRFLSDHFTILPAIDDPLPNHWDQWQATVDAGLNASTLFVQVLGALPGRKIAGSEQKPVIAQFDRAQAMGKRAIIWRPEALDLGTVSNARMKELLSAAEYCGALEEFKSEVKRLATPPKPRPVKSPLPGIANQPRIFINTGIEDIEQARFLSDRLKAMGCRCVRPLFEGTPEELRDDFRQQVQSCDGLIVFFGQIKLVWIRRQFDAIERYLMQRTQHRLAVCVGPPPKSTDLGIDWPDLEVIDGTEGFVEEHLDRWVATLRIGGDA